jgi:uncharacterized protein YoxC
MTHHRDLLQEEATCLKRKLEETK